MVRITELVRRGAYEPPSLAELRRLREIVWTAHPEMDDGSSIEMFADAMLAAASFGRTVAPWSGQYFSFWVERASDYLDHVGRPACSGPSFLAACLAHGDVVWRAPDRSRGQLLEVGLSAFSGAACRNVWRSILSGKATLLQPVPSEYPEHPMTTIRY